MRVVVVVQALAGAHPCEEPPVVRGVREVLTTAPVAESVDQGCEHEDVQHGVDETGNEARPEADRHTQQGQANAHARETAGEHPVEAILGQIRRERGNRVRVPALPDVVVDIEELNVPEAEQPGAMGIALAVRKGVVLAVHGHPLLPALAGGEPQNDAKDDLNHRVQAQGAVRECPMQVDRRGEDGDLGQRHRHDENRPHSVHAGSFLRGGRPAAARGSDELEMRRDTTSSWSGWPYATSGSTPWKRGSAGGPGGPGAQGQPHLPEPARPTADGARDVRGGASLKTAGRPPPPDGGTGHSPSPPPEMLELARPCERSWPEDPWGHGSLRTPPGRLPRDS